MKTLNPVILRELIEKIEVYQIKGTGKNRTQRVVIHYRFVGCLQIPEWHRKRKITLESRQGVAVNYLPPRHNKRKKSRNPALNTNVHKKRMFITELTVMNIRYAKE